MASRIPKKSKWHKQLGVVEKSSLSHSGIRKGSRHAISLQAFIEGELCQLTSQKLSVANPPQCVTFPPRVAEPESGLPVGLTTHTRPLPNAAGRHHGVGSNKRHPLGLAISRKGTS